ncbi:MAG: hypothetical protein GY773_09650, partial [Actinomycetia bacterium]|nr:hypothetical protein [Actinomycetes bacterium]
MRLSLAARLALVFASLVAITALVTTAAGVISTRVEVNDDVDRFLRDRADEIVSGQRLDPRDRNGGRAGQGDDRGVASGATIDDGAIEATVDADAEVQRLDSTGTVE